jgi:hypothetical protein
MSAEIRPPCNCEPANRRIFNGEIAIHFPGLEGLKKPIVWVFPKLAVCLSCGVAEFTIPERELTVLVKGKRTDDTIVFDQSA